MTKAEKFWDRMARGYKNPNYQPKGLSLKTLEATRPYLKTNQSVLDFGCGPGTLTLQLAKDVATVTGIDISSGMINVANTLANDQCNSNVVFLQTSIFDSSLKEQSFDVIVAFNVLHFVNDEKSINRLNALLKPGGLFISATACVKEKISLLRVLMAPLKWLGIIPPMQYFTLRDLEEVIKKRNFKILETQKLSRLPDYFIAAQKI